MNEHINDETSVYAATHRKPEWSPWATAGFGLIVLAVFLLVQFAVVLVYVEIMILNAPGADSVLVAEEMQYDGTLLSIATIIGAIVAFAFIAFFIKLRRTYSILDYLSFRKVKRSTLVLCVCLVLVIGGLMDTITYLLGRPVVHEFMSTAYTTVVFKPLLWFAICFAAPFFEEVFFRGFLFTGFQSSRLGNVGAILLTTLPWTLIHVQYGPYELSQIFLLGVVLGVVRVRTQSIVPVILMHMVVNLAGTIQTAIVISGG